MSSGFKQLPSIAGGSASELEYQLLLARDLKLIQPDDYEQLVQQTYAHGVCQEAES